MSLTTFLPEENSDYFRYNSNDVKWDMVIQSEADSPYIIFYDETLQKPFEDYYGYNPFTDSSYFVIDLKGNYHIFLNNQDYSIIYFGEDNEFYSVNQSNSDFNELPDDLINMLNYFNISYVLNNDERQFEETLSNNNISISDITNLEYNSLNTIIDSINTIDNVEIEDLDDEIYQSKSIKSDYYDTYYVFGEPHKDTMDKKGLEIIDNDSFYSSPGSSETTDFLTALFKGDTNTAQTYCAENTDIYNKIQKILSPNCFFDLAANYIKNDEDLRRDLTLIPAFQKLAYFLNKQYYDNSYVFYSGTVLNDKKIEYEYTLNYANDESLFAIKIQSPEEYRKQLYEDYPDITYDNRISDPDYFNYLIFEYYGDDILNNFINQYTSNVTFESGLFSIIVESINDEWKITSISEINTLLNQKKEKSIPQTIKIVEKNKSSLLYPIFSKAWNTAWDKGVKLYDFNKNRSKYLKYITAENIDEILNNSVNVCKENEKILTDEFHYKKTIDDTDYLYYGDFDGKSLPSGYGMLIRKFDGNYYLSYIGNFKNGKYNGFGINFYILEDIAYGYSWSKSCININSEENPLYIAHVIEEGNFSDNMLDGKANTYTMATNNNGNSITFSYSVGEYKNGEWNGTLKDYSGGHLTYNGSTKKGEYSGKGTLYYLNGKVEYSGSFKHGEYNGKGVLYDINGNVKHKGKFNMGEIE